MSFDARSFGLSEDHTAINNGQALVNAASVLRTTGLTLTLPLGTFDTTPMSFAGCSVVGQGTVLNVHGQGTAFECRGMLRVGGFTLMSMEPGQNGFHMLGGKGTIIEPITVLDFDGFGGRLGVAGASGVYFADIAHFEARNPTRRGEYGFIVDGLAIPNSNANVIRNLFVSGPWGVLWDIRGNGNTFIGGDAEPRHLADTHADTAIRISGSGNVLSNVYVEAVGAHPELFFDISGNGNRVSAFWPNGQEDNIDARTRDTGPGNNIEILSQTDNFGAGAVNVSYDNLIPNAGFKAIKPDGLPAGWVMTNSTGQVCVDEGLKMAVSDAKCTVSCWLATPDAAAPDRLPLETLPIQAFQGRTVTAGIWCVSDTPGLGALKIFDGKDTVGTARHSGSGKREFLVVQAQVVDKAKEVALVLRTDTNNALATGTCRFSDPAFVIGNSVTHFPRPRALPDTGGVVSGDVDVLGRLTASAADGSKIDVRDLLARIEALEQK